MFSAVGRLYSMKPQKSPAEAEAVTATFLALRLKLRRIAGAILRSDDDVDDALQETFLRAWQAAPGPEDRSPGGFMFTALRNVCLDMLRRRHPRADISLQTESAHQPLDTIDHRDTIGRVRQVMAARLSARERQVFELYTFGQLDYAEIAARLETSVESVRTAMSRARKIIKEYCSDI